MSSAPLEKRAQAFVDNAYLRVGAAAPVAQEAAAIISALLHPPTDWGCCGEHHDVLVPCCPTCVNELPKDLQDAVDVLCNPVPRSMVTPERAAAYETLLKYATCAARTPDEGGPKEDQ